MRDEGIISVRCREKGRLPESNSVAAKKGVMHSERRMDNVMIEHEEHEESIIS